MKRLFCIILGFAIICFCIEPVKAVTVTATLPSYDTGGPIDTAIAGAWTTIQTNAETELAKYDNQEKLAKGFANANSFATQAATVEGYQDYTLFALMTGAMVTLQAPAFTYNKEYVEKMRYKIERDGDAYMGVGAGVATVNAGVNTGFFIPGLYLNFKYGQVESNAKSFNSELEGFNYKELLLGGGINQILFWPRTAIPHVLKWRGINIGAGFYYSKTESSITILKSYITDSFDVGGTPYDLIMDPSFKIQVKSETMTVPLSITTSFIVFHILNLSLGTGVDYSFGHTEIKLKAAGSLTTSYGTPTTPGYVTIEGGTKETKPTTISPKITAGIGFNFSIVKIDIPLAVYYLDSGFCVGLSTGIIW